jgi:hypothetical protein
MTGHCLHRILTGASREDDIYREYNDWTQRWFDHDVAQLNDLYGKLRHVPSVV